MIPTADDYRQAASIIRRQGKATGMFYDAVSFEVCATGALAMACCEGILVYQIPGAVLTGHVDFQPFADYLEALGLTHSSWKHIDRIGVWNDQPHVTTEDVALVFEKMATEMDGKW